MKEFIELTEEFAKRIYDLENQRKKVAEFLRQLNSSSTLVLDNEIIEEKIFFPIQSVNLDQLKIAGVDGGLVKRSFHGIDLMLLRAVGVVFNYDKNKLQEVDYYPEAMPAPSPHIVFDPFSELEFEINSNLERQISEVTTATETIEKFEPDVLFLNGSVIPHYVWAIERNSLVYVAYKRMIEAYTKLFETVKKKKTILAGAIEDSRGTRFCEIINAKISPNLKLVENDLKLLLNRTKDSNLLTYALKLGERSFVFPYSSSPKEHPILKEFSEYQIFSFYVKTAEFDRPIRIDFLGDKGIAEVANKLSSVLLALSGHSGYGVPSVIIEADQRARLSENDLDMFYFDLINKAGNLPGLFERRRDQRPF